jgi:hypothetical protein
MPILKTIKTHLDRNRIGELMVIRNHLSPADLKSALERQRSDRRPLGQILVEDGYVTASQIRRIIALQYAMRAAAAAITLMVATVSFDPRPASAGSALKDIPSQITLASASVGSVAAYPELFGSGEKRSGDLSAFTKWSDMFARFDRDARSAEGAAVLASWKANLETMRGLPIDEMADRVNDMANKVR